MVLLKGTIKRVGIVFKWGVISHIVKKIAIALDWVGVARSI